MQDNDFGEYRPSASTNTCTDCGLCLTVCPFGVGPNEDELGRELYSGVEGIQYTPELGFFLESYCGAVSTEALRFSRTSGGLATWMLTRLLETNVVDRVICVASNPRPNRLFEFAEFSTPESLWAASRSSYYPVEISSCLRGVAQSKLRYAVIGLPCVVKGIRRAQRRMPALKRNIPVLLGLVCGQQRSKWFAEYLVRRAGLTMESVSRVSFRMKRETQPTSMSHFAIWADGDPSPRCVERDEGYDNAWAQSYFKQDACNYCDDVFAELADAVFMDAWLPGFRHDHRGTSIATARSPRCRSLLIEGVQCGTLLAEPLEIAEVIRSQEGCLRLKRDGVALQLSLAAGPSREIESRLRAALRWRAVARYRKAAEGRRMAASRTALIAQRAVGPGLEVFGARLSESTRNDTMVLIALNLLSLPMRSVGRAVRFGKGILKRIWHRIAAARE